MPLSDAHVAVLTSIKDEWNQAEQDIKIAEQVSNNIVIPAIKELRYSGRRVVEVLHVIVSDKDDEKIKSLLDDALLCCLRARHDAVDAATAKIAIDLEIMVEKLGYSAILTAYPSFASLFAALTSIREKIAVSRNKREDRNAIYAVLETVNFPDFVKQFNVMKQSEGMMKDLAKKSRSEHFFGKWGFVIGVAALAVAIVMAIFDLVKVHSGS